MIIDIEHTNIFKNLECIKIIQKSIINLPYVYFLNSKSILK